MGLFGGRVPIQINLFLLTLCDDLKYILFVCERVSALAATGTVNRMVLVSELLGSKRVRRGAEIRWTERVSDFVSGTSWDHAVF